MQMHKLKGRGENKDIYLLLETFQSFLDNIKGWRIELLFNPLLTKLFQNSNTCLQIIQVYFVLQNKQDIA